MVSRIWHGWTSPENADRYEDLLRRTVFPSIRARGVEGYRGIHLLRRSVGGEVEFTTIMWFDSLDAIRQFAGADHERAYVPPEARALLARFDEVSQHHEVREVITY